MDREELQLTERAARCRWDIPDEKRAELVATLVALALDPATKARQRITAIKTLAILDGITLKSVDAAVRADTHEQLVGRIEALEQSDDGKQPGCTPLPARVPMPFATGAAEPL